MLFAPRILSALALLAPLAVAQVDPRGRSVLFVRGADGSGGLGGGSFQARTEHLSDIRNRSTAPGNHGFGSLASLLRADGFTVSQWIESQGSLTRARLVPHRIVVFGSNNRRYSAAEVAAFHAYFDAGGSALFASDANWGPDWNAAPMSDNLFLARYGVQVYQDSANGIPIMRRRDPGRYLRPGHAVLSGADGAGGGDDVADYEGEGVSYFELRGAPGFRPTAVVSARGFRVRLLTASGRAGPTRPAGPNDVALFVVTKGASTIAGHFDRNTFFNPQGTGSDLTRRHNAQLARNLFRFLASVPGGIRTAGPGCGRAPLLALDTPALGRVQTWSITGAAPRAPSLLLLAPGAPAPFRFAGGCTLWPAFRRVVALPAPVTDGGGGFAKKLVFPGLHGLSAQVLTGQALVLVRGGALAGWADLSTGIAVRLGFAR